ncbi:hypothetical protein [Neobacillus sp. D3-1R]|uniref:hypothetical protein n=1 Tax=Neobacillus sp. D3-1R TaxID=3445778 RepID=UPI003FA190AB
MKKFTYRGMFPFIGILLIIGLWWGISKFKDLIEPLNQSDAFVYSNNAKLYWFELTSHKGKVEGNLHEEKLIDEMGKAPFIEKKKYPLTGKVIEKGYVFQVKKGEKMLSYDASFSGPHLSIQMQGNEERILYNPVDQKELNEYEKALLDYYKEERENEQLRKFFTELRKVYAYLYTSENSSYQLFIKIDEALLEGELTGSLLMVAETGNKDHPYEENNYVLNGVTGGNGVRFYTTVEGKETKLEGKFLNSVNEMKLSFWATDDILTFHAVTAEEYKQKYDEFKEKVQ